MKPVDPQEYWENRLAQTYSLQSVGNISLSLAYNRWLYKIRARAFMHTILDLFPEVTEISVLDIGAGTGFYEELAQSLGIRNLTGIDLTHVATENLNKKYPEYSFKQMDITAGLQSGLSQDFDLVMAMDVLFHIVDDIKYQIALKTIWQYLKPGGYFLFTENFIHFRHVIAPHIYSRNLDDIYSCMTDIGFEFIFRKPLFFWMNTPLDTRNNLMHLIWKVNRTLVHRNEFIGSLVGACLYSLEILTTSLAKESPSTEIALFRRSF